MCLEFENRTEMKQDTAEMFAGAGDASVEFRQYSAFGGIEDEDRMRKGD